MNRFFLILLSVFIICSCNRKEAANTTTINWQKVTEFPDSVGRSGCVVGLLNGNLLVGGGANFPKLHPKDGGAKTFYDDIYLLKDDKWIKLSYSLPKKNAYSISITTSKGIIVIGGTDNGKRSLESVYLLREDNIKELSPMPYPLNDATGTILGDKIYVAGGVNNGQPFFSKVLVYDIAKNCWSEIDSPLLSGRVQLVSSAQNDAEDKCFIIYGGYDPISKEIHKDGYKYSPSKKTWNKIEDAPCALNGGVMFSYGIHSVMFTCGVNEDIFHSGIAAKGADSVRQYLSHEKAWYRFNNRLYSYNTILNKWTENGTIPDGIAGAGIAEAKDGIWLVMGETQPGVRTSNIWFGKVNKDISFGWVNWIVVAIYLVGLLMMGLYFMRRQKTSDQYFTGGGKIPWWAVSISIFATMLSAITFMAIPAKTYATDWRYFVMAVAIFFVALPVIKYFLPFFRRLKITTAYQYLELRFNATVRVMASLLFILFMIARMALVIYLPSLALTAATGIDIFLCIILMSIITVIYSSIGGIEAVIWGDVVQGIILMGGAIFVLIYLITGTDGNALQIAIENEKFQILNWSFDFTSATFWVVLIGGSVNSLISYSSDQTIIQRYMTTSDEKKSAKSIFTNGILSVISSFLFYAIGTALFCYFYSRPETLDFSMPTGDSIFPFYIITGLPVVLSGLLIAAIFAASMSTISSNINSISTAWIVDIRSKFRSLPQDDKSKLNAAKNTSLVVGAIGCMFAIMMAIWNVLSLFDWFNMILGLLTGGLCSLFIMGIFIERIDGISALIGFIAGFIAVVLISNYTHLFFLMYGTVNIIISLLVSLLVSFIIPKKNKKLLEGLTWKRRPQKID